jgi:aminoglycoside/choline kinase family phosphotransferase
VGSSSLVQRQQALQSWAVQQLAALGLAALRGDIEAVSGDASFRRYFRGHTATGSLVWVDAPPEQENSRPFIDIDRRLLAAGVRVPRLLAADADLGFMCLEDFGDLLLWSPLEQARLARDYALARQLYQRCFDQLLLIQKADAHKPPLPLYDTALLLREMRLFTEWFCGGLLQRQLSAAEQKMMEAAFAVLCENALQQTQVFVHRDYHSRNLMLLKEAGTAIGVIDFQDAVAGPLAYDLVSLLKDCYIEWPRSLVNEWALQFAAQAKANGVLPTLQPPEFLREFDLMGAQRHIKVLGIFSRLWLRDGKSGYLKDIPLTFRYLQQVASEQPPLADFAEWLAINVAPQLPAALVVAETAASCHGAGR